MIKSFDPILPKEPRILVLGSAPSVISLEKVEYYGNTRNAFWKILIEKYLENENLSYKKKVGLALKNNIAIWDVVGSCSRKGSLDSAIKDVVVNDIESLILNNSSLKKVLFNGNTSFVFYKRYISFFPSNIEFKKMPSTSPAYTLSYKEKKEIWNKALD